MNVLDVGCGHAPQAHTKHGNIGVDLKKGLCDIQGNAVMLPFKDNTFLQVNCYHCLEHIIDFGQAIKEIKRVLKQGGMLVIEVPNPSSFWTFKDYVISRKALLKNEGISKEHICCWGESEIQNLMREFELRVLKIVYVTSTRNAERIRNYHIIKRVFYMLLFRAFPAFQNAFRIYARKP